MTTKYATVEVWALVDENGDYGVGTTPEAAADDYTNNIGEINGQVGMRQVKATIKVPLPTPIELSGEVQVDESAAGLAVA